VLIACCRSRYVGYTLYNLGRLLFEMGELDEAGATFARAFAVLERTHAHSELPNVFFLPTKSDVLIKADVAARFERAGRNDIAEGLK
jgi:hypothetical protein